MSEYDEQAKKFLKKTKTTLTVELAETQDQPDWDFPGKHYKFEVTLKNNNGSYTFNFWDSIVNAEKIDALKYLKEFRGLPSYAGPQYFKAQDKMKEIFGKKISPYSLYRKDVYEELERKLYPSAYSVLASLSLVYEDSFEEWCSSFGYDTDSKRADKTYRACIEQDRMLRRMFNTKELEMLEEIQ